MTGTLSEWLGHHPQMGFSLAAIVILAAYAVAAKPLLRDKLDDAKGPDWAWSIILFIVLLSGRWPSILFPREINPDESQLLAGAHALTLDPVFWRSVNGWTAGPLDFFALWPAGWLCQWEGYLPARLSALGLIGLGLTLVHQCISLLAGRTPARLATLAVASFEALTNAPDFLHYSTELAPVTLQMGAFYALVRRRTGGGMMWCAAGGLLLGAIPFTKLQAAPLAALTGLGWLAIEILPRRFRPGLVLAGTAALPALIFAAQLTWTREWPGFLQSYWEFNLHYAVSTGAPLDQVLRETLAASTAWDGMLDYWLPALLAALAALLLLPAMRPSPVGRWLLLAGLAAAASLASVLTPLRPFLHYWQLLMPPLGGLLGFALAHTLTGSDDNRHARRFIALAAAAGLIFPLLLQRGLLGARYASELADPVTQSRSMLSARLLSHARPGERLAVWGWSNYVYVETGLIQAARDPHVQFLIEPTPLQGYFRQRYLADLQHIRPETFVDSVGRFSLTYTRPEYGHDRLYPELAAWIETEYRLVDQLHGARIYRRRDLAGR